MTRRRFSFFSSLYALVAYLFVLPALLLFIVLPGRWSQALRFRLGTVLRLKAPPQGKEVIWLHASSVGELKIAQRLAEILQKEERCFYLSVFTRTGFHEARKLKIFSQVFMLPPDIPLFMRFLVHRIHPKLLCVIESDFWLSMTRQVQTSGGKVILVNGRMSEKATRNHRRFPFYLQEITSSFDLCLMRSTIDAERLRLFCPSEKVKVTGNLKFDIFHHAHEQASFFHDKEYQYITLASTRDGEEELLLQAFSKPERRLFFRQRKVRLFLAPRHISRIREVEGILHHHLIPFCRLSSLDCSGTSEGSPLKSDTEVILIDRLGFLAPCYDHSVAAFIGGSLVPKGGQNLLEAISASLPVCFGNDMSNFLEEAQFFEKYGAKRCKNAEEVFSHLTEWVKYPEEAEILGRTLHEALQEKRSVSALYQKETEGILKK